MKRRTQLFWKRRYLVDLARQFLGRSAIDLSEPIGLQIEMRGKALHVGKSGAANFVGKPYRLGVTGHGRHDTIEPARRATISELYSKLICSAAGTGSPG